MITTIRFKIIAGKINKIPQFYTIFARKMPDYIINPSPSPTVNSHPNVIISLDMLTLFEALTPTVNCRMCTAIIKHPVPVPDRFKPSFVIFDIRAL